MLIPTSEIPFTHVDLHLSHEDRTVLENFNITQDAQADFSGNSVELSENFTQIPQDDREKLNQLLCDGTKIESTPPNYGSIFIVGDQTCGAVHSEPDLSRNRLFMSVLPGTTNEINEHLSVEKMSIEALQCRFNCEIQQQDAPQNV